MSAVLLSLSLLAGQALAQSYTLSDSYTPSNFFSKFDFFTGSDPTHGFVDYVDYNTAVSSGLIADTSKATWGVDSKNTLSTSSSGRPSIRLSSKQTYNHGLFIADFAHMPDSTCGLWPAYWFLGQTGTWPNSGELDVVEGVNNAQTNLISAHTKDGCTVSGTAQFAKQQGNNCAVSAGTTGCTNSDSRTTSYGTGFNANGGGVYAMDWTSDAIQVWFFPRNSIPESIASGNPDPSSDFGTPTANFASGCNIDKQFFDMAIIFDTTFCGDWAGASYGGDSCPMFSGQQSQQSCTSYVAQNPSAFKNAYWDVNSIQVYTQSDDGQGGKNKPDPSSTASTAAPSSAVPTSAVPSPTTLTSSAVVPPGASSSASPAPAAPAPQSSQAPLPTPPAPTTTTPAATQAPAPATTSQTASHSGWRGHRGGHRGGNGSSQAPNNIVMESNNVVIVTQWETVTTHVNRPRSTYAA